MKRLNLHPLPSRARGGALLVLALILGTVFATLFVNSLSRRYVDARREQITHEAMSRAKEALIHWAIAQTYSGNINQGRPGELPCPDRNAPGTPDAGTSGLGGLNTCQTAAQRIARLPWRALGMTAPQDGAGETLWYMVTAPFQDSETGAGSAINSNTTGSLQAFTDKGLTPLTTTGNRAVAIVFAPGAPLGGQNRNTAAQQTNPANYLDNIAPPNAAGAFNNASNNPANPKLNGPIADASGNIVFNDRLIVITQSEIMSRVRQRAAREYLVALNAAGLPSPQPPFVTPPCSGRPPSVENVGNFDPVNWLNLNQWETVLVYSVPPCVATATVQ